MTTVLDMAAIESLLANTRKRGVYEPHIDTFANSDELAMDFTALPEFTKSDANAVRNSVRLTIDKKTKENEWPNMQVTIDRSSKNDHRVILINLDVLAAAQAV